MRVAVTGVLSGPKNARAPNRTNHPTSCGRTANTLRQSVLAAVSTGRVSVHIVCECRKPKHYNPMQRVRTERDWISAYLQADRRLVLSIAAFATVVISIADAVMPSVSLGLMYIF